MISYHDNHDDDNDSDNNDNDQHHQGYGIFPRYRVVENNDNNPEDADTMNIFNMTTSVMTHNMSCSFSKGRMAGRERLWKMMAMILIDNQ